MSVNTSGRGEDSGEGRSMRGSNPNSGNPLARRKTAYVIDSATNAIAVIRIDDANELEATGWLPNSVGTSRDGKVLFASQGKNPAGPNTKYCSDTTNSDARNTQCDLTQE